MSSHISIPAEDDCLGFRYRLERSVPMRPTALGFRVVGTLETFGVVRHSWLSRASRTLPQDCLVIVARSWCCPFRDGASSLVLHVDWIRSSTQLARRRLRTGSSPRRSAHACGASGICGGAVSFSAVRRRGPLLPILPCSRSRPDDRGTHTTCSVSTMRAGLAGGARASATQGWRPPSQRDYSRNPYQSRSGRAALLDLRMDGREQAVRNSTCPLQIR